MRLVAFVRPGGDAAGLPGLPLLRKAGLVLILGALSIRGLHTSAASPVAALHAARRALLARELETDRRWAPVRRALPPRGVVQLVYSPGDDVALAYLAQFALAPLVLTSESAASHLVVEDPAIRRSRTTSPAAGLDLVFRTPDGISLWRRSRP